MVTKIVEKVAPFTPSYPAHTLCPLSCPPKLSSIVLNSSVTLRFQLYLCRVSSAYSLAYGAFLLLGGRLGDLFGHRNIYILGVTWFSIWSIVNGFSHSPVMLSISRALQGMGAGFTVPSALAILTTTYPVGPERTRALSIFGGTAAIGSVFGVLLGGILGSTIGKKSLPTQIWQAFILHLCFISPHSFLVHSSKQNTNRLEMALLHHWYYRLQSCDCRFPHHPLRPGPRKSGRSTYRLCGPHFLFRWYRHDHLLLE